MVFFKRTALYGQYFSFEISTFQQAGAFIKKDFVHISRILALHRKYYFIRLEPFKRNSTLLEDYNTCL